VRIAESGQRHFYFQELHPRPEMSVNIEKALGVLLAETAITKAVVVQ
jgi:hypothetical protein